MIEMARHVYHVLLSDNEVTSLELIFVYLYMCIQSSSNTM